MSSDLRLAAPKPRANRLGGLFRAPRPEEMLREQPHREVMVGLIVAGG